MIQAPPTPERNEGVHNSFTLADLLSDIKNHLGVILIGEAGHGKSYTAVSLVKEAMQQRDLSVIVLSPSTIWKRKFGKIQCVKVGTLDLNPILETDEISFDTVTPLRDTVFINLDKKWSYERSAWLEGLLESKQYILFEVKYRNGRRIKAFESVVLSYIYESQEIQLDVDPSYPHHYLIVLEEVQNSFGTYSMNADDSLELMTLFTQSRSDARAQVKNSENQSRLQSAENQGATHNTRN